MFLEIFDFIGMEIITAILSLVRTLLHLPVALVFAEYLPKEKFATGYGLFMFIQGNLIFLMSPTVGWIRDITQSYVIYYHSVTIIMAICAVPWIIEILWFKLYPREKNYNNNK